MTITYLGFWIGSHVMFSKLTLAACLNMPISVHFSAQKSIKFIN